MSQTARYYAAYGEDGRVYGLGASIEECEADAAKCYVDCEFGDVEEEGPSLEEWNGSLRYRELTRAAYDALVSNWETAITHRCETGLIDVGSDDDCELCQDAGYPGEGDEMHTYMLASLTETRDDLLRRLDSVNKEIESMRTQSEKSKQRAANMWRQALVSIHYAWITHRNYVKNNAPMLDRERLMEPTPANVLATASRRRYAPTWMTPAHMLRAMREIEAMQRRGEWNGATAELQPATYRRDVDSDDEP